MTTAEAKQILLLYRPGSADAAEPPMAEALELARRDLELGAWLQHHCAFQDAMRAKFREIEVPAQLKARIAAAQKIVPLPVWRRQPVWLAAAASVALLLGLASLWFKPTKADGFANFQARMVSTALREYRMDIVTNDMSQVRQFMAARGAPADYEVAPGLSRLQLTGGGLLRWRNHPVSMVCFDRGDKQMLYLFVMDRTALKDPPPSRPQLNRVNELLAVSWSEGDKTYLLTGPEESDFLRKYL